jgi:flagellar L-ring protein precursor FlgH
MKSEFILNGNRFQSSAVILGFCAFLLLDTQTLGQSSSLFRQAESNPAASNAPLNSSGLSAQQMVQANVSYFAVKPLPKRLYKIGDLITVIVRQKSSYTHNGKADLERQVDIDAELKDWIKINKGNLQPDPQTNGDPKIKFSLDRQFQGDGKFNRTNEVVTRVSCKIIDVLPNGCLVLQGGPDIIETDGEKQTITLTGTCRSEDILSDNTILSTQLMECHFKQDNTGAVRDQMERGWITKLWDICRPF